MEKLDKKIIELNNQKYLVYLKRVAVKASKQGKREAVRAFVKKLKSKPKHLPMTII